MRTRYHVALGIAFLSAVALIGVAAAQPQKSATMPPKSSAPQVFEVDQVTKNRIAAAGTKPGLSQQQLMNLDARLNILRPQNACPTTALRADVVAIDHPMVFNRLGAQNVNWMMYALRHDVIDLKTNKTLNYSAEGDKLFEQVVTRSSSRDIALRPDLRPRPLVLRVAESGYLKVRFTNLLEVKANPFKSDPDPLPNIDHPMEQAPKDSPGTPDDKRILRIDDQVASRVVGFHPQGLELVSISGLPGIHSDSSSVGQNPDSAPNSLTAKAGSMVEPGRTTEYCFFAPKEGAYLVSNPGAVFGGEGTAGNSGVGLFAAVTVQPQRAKFYRAQVTEEELRLTTTGVTPTGQPIVNYEATYPAVSPWSDEGKSGLPILNMVQGNRIIHGDINAIIVGSEKDGRFLRDTYPIERDVAVTSGVARNPTVPNRLEPFREFVSVFHDENAATQSYPYFFEHPELGHTLHGVRDAFMINYGSGGIGAEIIANRLHSGPMHDCLDCAYEEFFLSSFAVGDAAMIVDYPANMVTHRCQPEFLPDQHGKWASQAMEHEYKTKCVQDKWATEAYYPHDPANLHHSYIGDFVKFRNLHSGKEQHIFHLHNHQWLFNPNDDNSNYIDAQGLGPGSGYTYEIAFGGSGNRNKTVGDAIFHCHFYPHFAQGMWYMWRNHDVFEVGTRLEVSDTATGVHERPFGLAHGKPSAKARALPDGEIVAGTPIPAIVPLPGKGMAPMPVPVRVKPRIGDDGKNHGSVAEVLSPEKVSEHGNPGFPFWVAGVSQRAGQSDPVSMGSRPTTPPLDMDSSAGGHNGGLPRHALGGYSAEGHDRSEVTRLSAAKEIEEAKPIYYDEGGTPLEQVAMKFHAQRIHPTHKQVDKEGVAPPVLAEFITNGAPPTPGAPYNEPCIDDKGIQLVKGQPGYFFNGVYNGYYSSNDEGLGGIQFGAGNPRVYKGANLQLDVVFNKVGYHYPQQRILTLWEDVPGLLTRQRPPEPLVLRLNTYDCAVYQHTNLVPKEFYLDDYQITTPTDVIGQHIHLPKWDLTSADGGANGFNYEDGTFSPGAVRERVRAINEWNKHQVAAGKPQVPQPGGSTSPLVPAAHPYFGKASVFQTENLQLTAEECLKAWTTAASLTDFEHKWGIPGKCDWFGARTTIQRWFSDPIVNRELIHRGLGITFTHDHLGPSTHQQLGLYATMLTEPPNSQWVHNETGEVLYTRPDGGPTTWQARILGKTSDKKLDVDRDELDDSHREFFLQFGDFQHAYEKDIYVGVTKGGIPYTSPLGASATATSETFRHAIHPSVRKPAQPNVFPDIIGYSPKCPGGEKGLEGAVYDATKGAPSRPCAEAISADDVGMMVVNYRNEPVAARVYDPTTKKQAAGFSGDLSFALQTRTDRKISSLNTRLGDTPYPSLTSGILRGDPFTPIMRVYSGDLVRVKVQGGAHEHEHNGTINGLAWLQGGSGFGQAPHSGWRNSQNTGLSEQFTFMARLSDISSEMRSPGRATDRLYSVDTSQDGMWSGVWGVLRSYTRLQKDREKNLTLNVLPSNPKPKSVVPDTDPSKDMVGLTHVCPKDARPREYHVVAVLANNVLHNDLGVKIPPASDGARLKAKGGTLIYNPRRTELKLPIEVVDETGNAVGGTTLLPRGPLHDPTAIMFVLKEDLDVITGRIKTGRPVEPLVLRAAAGDCIRVTLENRLPRVRSHMPDLDGYTSLSGIVIRDAGSPSSQMTSFNNNLIRPSNHIGLHPQMVYYDPHRADGNNVGVNYPSTVPPGWTKVYEWYAGTLHTVGSAEACPTTPTLPSFVTQPGEVQFIPPPTYQITTDNLLAISREVLERELPDKPSITLDPKLLNQLVNVFQSRIPIQGFNAPGQQSFTPLKPGVLMTKKVIDQQAILSMPVSGITDQAGIRTELLNFLRKEPLLGNDTRVDHLADTLIDEFKAVSNPVELTAQTENAYLWSADVPPIMSTPLEELSVVPAVAVLKSKPGPKVCSFDGVEFGGSNLTPPDRIKQGQKGAVGALVVEPESASWSHNWTDQPVDDLAADRQKPGQKRQSRATANIKYPVTEQGQGVSKAKCNDSKHKPGQRCREFRESVLVHQKGLNLRYANGDAVQSLASERAPGDHIKDVAPEDAHDAGQMAINYGTEPMWFRFGLSPDHIFGTDSVRNEGFGGISTAYQAFSNRCCAPDATASHATPNVGEPYTPISTVYAGSELRVRALLPTGIGRATIFSLHGHNWPRDPYLAEHTWRVASDRGDHPKGGAPASWGVPSKCIGYSAAQMGMGGQESLTPMAHFDLMLKSAGGRHAVAGDYLWQDHGGFGITSGLWSLVRVVPPKTPIQKHELRTPCQYEP